MRTHTRLNALLTAAMLSLPAAASAQDGVTRLPGEMMFPATSADVWEHVQKLLKDLRFGSEKTDRKHQIAVTSWRSYDPAVLPNAAALGLDAQVKPNRIQLHILVAPRPQPARVAVGSVIELRSPGPRGERTSYFYGGGVIDRWFLGLIAERIRAQGIPVALDWNRRIEDAKQLLPAGVSEPCLVGLSGLGAGGWKPPVPVSDPAPLFPEQGFASRAPKVAVTGWVTEHGTMTHLHVTNPRPGFEHYESSARAAVSLWRFEPAQKGGCPIPVSDVTVEADYRVVR